MQDINEIITEAFNKQKITVPSDAWPFIAEALRKRKKRRTVWFILSFLTIFLLSTTAILFNKNSKIEKMVVTDNISSTDNNLTKPNDINEIEKTKNVSKLNNDIAINKNKIIKKDSATLLTIAGNDEEIFGKNVIRKKTKSCLKVNIKTASATTDDEKNVSFTKDIKKETENYLNENAITKTNNDKEIITDSTNIFSLKTDTILEKIVSVQTTTKKGTEKDENKKVDIKIINKNKWKPYIGISYGTTFVSNKNLFNSENKNTLADNAQINTAYAPLRSDINNRPDYYTGKEFFLSFLLKKENKKFQPLFGLNITIGNFNTRAYATTSAALDANTFVLDSTQAGNSNYAAKSTISTNKQNIKNNFMHIGLIIGCNIPLHTFKKDSRISLQLQAISTYYLSQSIQWFDKSSTRYFTSNKLINNFNVAQSTALLWETNIKKKIISAGPYFNFNYLQLNKNVNNISNIYLKYLGLQINLKLKK